MSRQRTSASRRALGRHDVARDPPWIGPTFAVVSASMRPSRNIRRWHATRRGSRCGPAPARCRREPPARGTSSWMVYWAGRDDLAAGAGVVVDEARPGSAAATWSNGLAPCRPTSSCSVSTSSMPACGQPSLHHPANPVEHGRHGRLVVGAEDRRVAVGDRTPMLRPGRSGRGRHRVEVGAEESGVPPRAAWAGSARRGCPRCRRASRRRRPRPPRGRGRAGRRRRGRRRPLRPGRA